MRMFRIWLAKRILPRGYSVLRPMSVFTDARPTATQVSFNRFGRVWS